MQQLCGNVQSVQAIMQASGPSASSRPNVQTLEAHQRASSVSAMAEDDRSRVGQRRFVGASQGDNRRGCFRCGERSHQIKDCVQPAAQTETVSKQHFSIGRRPRYANV